MNRRKNTDNCLLCNLNLATKENSHIIPKFMTKSIFGVGQVRRAFGIGTNTSHKEPEYLQDSPKENFILCPDCETFFQILETYFSTRLHNRLWSVRFNSQFDIIKPVGGLTYKICNEIDSKVVRLFFDSIIWRCHISSNAIFKNFFLSNNSENTLAENLIRYKSLKQSDLLSKTHNFDTKIASYPILVLTADNFKDRTKNFLFANPSMKDPYQLILNEYYLLFSFTENNEQRKFTFLNNDGNDKFKIGFLQSELWDSLGKSHREMMAKKTIESLKKNDQMPYWLKDN